MRQYIITEAEANMVLAYLARQKYEDVFQLINMIQQVVAKREHFPSNDPQAVEIPTVDTQVEEAPAQEVQEVAVEEAPAQEVVSSESVNN